MDTGVQAGAVEEPAVVARNREEGGAEVTLTIPLAAISLGGEGEHV